MEDSVAPPLGQGRYRLTEVLGAGGMAVVYKAFDARLDVSRAVKVLNPAMDDHARIRFFNEARTMAKLHHKHVVTVHDVADDGDRTYLVMELIEGGSVADRMAAYGPLPPRMACEVAIALLDGLEAAHKKGIVHRDVKPHNVLVGQDGLPKVTDFGIASVSDYSSTKTGAVIGTWAYMAPEQRTDSKSVDARADVFGAGCSLYNMVTGVDPFDLYNQEAYEEKYAIVPEPLRDLIQKSTRYKAADRYATAGDFRDALKALLPDLPDDPEDTPALGVALTEHRAEIVPTLLEANLERSNPTLSAVKPPPNLTELEDPRDHTLPWIGALAAVVILFLGGGLLIGFLLVAGIVVVGGGEATADTIDVEVPAEPGPVAPVAPPGPIDTDSNPVVPEPAEPPPAQPEPKKPVEPQPVEPSPVRPTPVASPRPKPPPEPEPEPKAKGHVVRLSSQPVGNIQANGAWYKSGDSLNVPDGTYLEVDFYAEGMTGRRVQTVHGQMDICQDLVNNRPCR